jgi:hypothetical protein
MLALIAQQRHVHGLSLRYTKFNDSQRQKGRRNERRIWEILKILIPPQANPSRALYNIDTFPAFSRLVLETATNDEEKKECLELLTLLGLRRDLQGLVRAQEGLVRRKLGERDVKGLIAWTFGKPAGIEVLELLKILQKANTDGPRIKKPLELARRWASGWRSLGQIQQQPPPIGPSSPYYNLFFIRRRRKCLRKLIN